jgi:hypothetical protein
MVTKEVSNRIDEIRKEKAEWNSKQVAIQAIGEIIEEKDGFIDSFLMCESYNEDYGVLWVSEDIDYIPAKTLELLGKNGMGIKKQNLNRTNQIEFK